MNGDKVVLWPLYSETVRPSNYALAALILVATCSLAVAQGSNRVGVTSATTGDPLGKPPAGAERVLRIGIDIQANELVTTEALDRAHLVFLDGTALTVGPNARLTVDKYVFDPNTATGELAVNVSRGVFRLVGGRISKAKPMIVTTPSSTIGIRGGIMVGVVGPDRTEANFLFGLSMTATNNGVTQTATRPSSRIVTRLGEAPGAPVLIPKRSLDSAMASLEGRPAPHIGNPDELATSSGFAAHNSGLGIDAGKANGLRFLEFYQQTGNINDALTNANSLRIGSPGTSDGRNDTPQLSIVTPPAIAAGPAITLPPAVTPPVVTPPVVTLPVVGPPVVAPPVVIPPVVTPVVTPPVVTPPVVTPPVVTPPVVPVVTPPVVVPPVVTPPRPPVIVPPTGPGNFPPAPPSHDSHGSYGRR